MENNLHKYCKCCKNEIDINSINVSNLYLIRLDTMNIDINANLFPLTFQTE